MRTELHVLCEGVTRTLTMGTELIEDLFFFFPLVVAVAACSSNFCCFFFVLFFFNYFKT